MKNLNKKIDYRAFLIKNKIIEINNAIKSLENQINDCFNNFSLVDENTLKNNIFLIKSVISYYKGQKNVLIGILGDYCSIMSNKNKKEKDIFLKIWREQVDLIFSNNFSFDFSYDECNNSIDECEQKKHVKI